MTATAAPIHRPEPIVPAERRLADSLLLLHATLVDDLEAARIAADNRLRALVDEGVNPALPELVRMAQQVDELAAMEHAAVLTLKRAMRAHYLADWVQRTPGVGEKQAARLLAAIGDPATRPNPAKLWAYCGLHVLHPGQSTSGDHSTFAGVDPSARPGHARNDAQMDAAGAGPSTAGDRTATDSHSGDVPGGHTPPDNQSRPAAGDRHPTDHCADDTHTRHVGGVAPKRQRGQRANWNTEAKTRVYLVAESCIKAVGGPARQRSPYRDVYEQGRAKYADAVHNHPCVRCGPSGSPAQPGSPLNDGHKHARAMRLVMKAILLDLWKEARREVGAA